MAEKKAGAHPLGRVIGGLALLVGVAILVSLGTWQVQRLFFKQTLIATISERRAAAPLPLEKIEALKAAGIDVEYRRVSVRGRFDHSRERYFLATLDGQPGFHVYTPMMLEDGRALFVNRGFVPEALRDPVTRKVGQIEGKITIDGFVRQKLKAKPGSMVPDNDLAKNLYFWKDLDSMASSAGLARDRVVGFFVDAAPNRDPTLLPKGGVTIFDLPDNHLQYAITWYGLALALSVIAFLASRKNRR